MAGGSGFMERLGVIENELVPVYVTSTGEKVVYGTELYGVLEPRGKAAVPVDAAVLY